MKSGELIQGFTRDLSYDEYKCSSLVRAAVERHFEIIGEALNRLAKIDTELAAQVTDYERIIAFRNVIAHGYDLVSDEVVWEIVHEKLPIVLAEARALLHS